MQRPVVPVIPFALALLSAALLGAGGAAAQTFVFDPFAPDSNDLILAEATYFTSCFTGGSSVEVLDRFVALVATEACICPLAPPSPVTISEAVGPLAAGDYEVSLVVVPDPRLPNCDFEPRPQGSTTLTVSEAAYELSVDPRAPTTADVVTLQLKAPCGMLVDLPRIVGSVIRINDHPATILPPCGADGVLRESFSVGTLEAGRYTVLVLSEQLSGVPDNPVRHELHLVLPFDVRPAPAPELALHLERFRVTVDWTRRSGATGTATALPLTDDTGAFWFFDPAVLELVVKVVPGCGVNGHFWVFAGGLTDVETRITVEDTYTGASKTYPGAQGVPFAPLQDVEAFPCP